MKGQEQKVSNLCQCAEFCVFWYSTIPIDTVIKKNNLLNVHGFIQFSISKHNMSPITYLKFYFELYLDLILI